jgi:hypothetical protein
MFVQTPDISFCKVPVYPEQVVHVKAHGKSKLSVGEHPQQDVIFVVLE